MKKLLGFGLSGALLIVILAGCGSVMIDDSSDSTTGSSVMTGSNDINESQRHDIHPLFSGYAGYYTDGIDIYRDENRFNPGDMSLVILSGVTANDTIFPLDISGSLSYRWLQDDNDLRMEDKKISSINLSTMTIEKDLFCGNSMFLSDDTMYYFVNQDGIVQSWDKDNMVLDGKFVEYVTFGYQENGTPTANDDTLLVFFTPESAGVCKIIEIPNIGAYYQEISASWNIMRLSLRIDTGNGALYEVTSDGYRVIE